MINLEGKRIVLYARVSTTEQKDKGYSLPQQKEYLTDFCLKNGCKIVEYFEEDYTGKHFERPQFQKLIKLVSNRTEKIDYVLVHCWDRYARNCPMSYHYLYLFQSLKIELNAITQWIDYKDPSHGMILGLYFLMPDVDNKIKAHKTKLGIIGALKEGRFINRAPIGYKNGKDNHNDKKPLISPCQEKAVLIQKIFSEYATGNFTQEELRLKYRAHGLNLKSSQFSRMLSNVLYIGKVIVPAHDNKPMQMIEGLHEAIIAENTFYQVQSVKVGKTNFKTSSSNSEIHNENLPLRGGYLKCPECGRNLTGSQSTSRNKSKHYYYHCSIKSGCKFRVNAEKVNNSLVELLEKIRPSRGVVKLFKEILIQQYQQGNLDRANSAKKIIQDINFIEGNLDVLTEKLIQGRVDDESYDRLRKKYNIQLSELKAKKTTTTEHQKDLDKFIDFGVSLISNIDQLYIKAPVNIKRRLLGSIFLEKLVFEKDKYRTAKFNEVITLISNNHKALRLDKNKMGEPFSRFSHSVPGAGVEPARFPTGV